MPSTVAYCTPNEVFDNMEQRIKDDKVSMNGIINAVSRFIDGYCNRAEFGFVAGEDDSTWLIGGNGKAYLYIPDCITLTSVEMKTSIQQTSYDYTFPANDIVLFRGSPTNPQFNRSPYHGIMIQYNAVYPFFTSGKPAHVTRQWQRLYPDRAHNDVNLPTVRITGRFGYDTSTPPIIKQVAIFESIRLFQQQAAGMGDSAFNNEIGERNFIKALHPTSQAMLKKANLIMPKASGTARQ